MNLHEALIKLKKLHALGNLPEPSRGICENVCILVGYAVEEISYEIAQLALSWPKCSGNYGFPVPSHKPLLTAINAYIDATDSELWYEGEYATLRLELLDFLIEKTKPQT